MKKKIVHITSLHRRDDSRVFQKQLITLSKHFECYYIIADGLGDTIVKDIQIYDVGKPLGTKDRLTRIKKLILKKALEINADLYQYHDPEMNLVGLKLLKKGKRVIYDAHEDSPRQYTANSKGNKSNFKIKLVSKTLEYLENKTAKKLSGIITATEGIQTRFLKFNKNTITIKNYVILEGLSNTVRWTDKENAIAYIGGISKKRGIMELLDVVYQLKITLKLAGIFQPPSLEQECRNHKGWQYVDYKGLINRKEVNELLSQSKIGMLTLYPTPNHNLSLPIKLFEYMASGIPVIASNIPIWEEIVNHANCGIIVDPKNTEEIALAITKLFKEYKESKLMGENGKIKALKKYNWVNEGEKLIEFYKGNIA